MRLLMFDTETTGLPLWKEPSDHPDQPHLVQLALVEVNTDTREEIQTANLIVKPDGWTIPDEVVAVHGITMERAMDEGVPEQEAVDTFVGAASDGGVIAAYGLSFDMRIMRIAMTRHGWDKDRQEAWAKTLNGYDVMAPCTPLCKIPPTEKMMATGRKTFKTPSLTEAVKILLGRRPRRRARRDGGRTGCGSVVVPPERAAASAGRVNSIPISDLI